MSPVSPKQWWAVGCPPLLIPHSCQVLISGGWGGVDIGVLGGVGDIGGRGGIYGKVGAWGV